MIQIQAWTKGAGKQSTISKGLHMNKSFGIQNSIGSGQLIDTSLN